MHRSNAWVIWTAQIWALTRIRAHVPCRRPGSRRPGSGGKSRKRWTKKIKSPDTVRKKRTVHGPRNIYSHQGTRAPTVNVHTREIASRPIRDTQSRLFCVPQSPPLVHLVRGKSPKKVDRKNKSPDMVRFFRTMSGPFSEISPGVSAGGKRHR